jgi:hypothetical protein
LFGYARTVYFCLVLLRTVRFRSDYLILPRLPPLLFLMLVITVHSTLVCGSVAACARHARRCFLVRCTSGSSVGSVNVLVEPA